MVYAAGIRRSLSLSAPPFIHPLPLCECARHDDGTDATYTCVDHTDNNYMNATPVTNNNLRAFHLFVLREKLAQVNRCSFVGLCTGGHQSFSLIVPAHIFFSC